MVYSGAWGTLIYEKNLKSKFSCQTPFKAAPGPGSVNADSSPDPESKSGPKWPGSGSRVLIRPIMAWIRTSFFFLFNFLLVWCLWPLKKKGVEQKQKQKQKQKQSGPFFFGLDVFFGVAISFFPIIVNWPFLFHLFGQGSWSGLVPTYVVSQSWLVVTQSGPDPATSRGAAPRTDAIYLAPDPDLGPDPSPGSAVCRSGFSVNLRRKNFNC